MTRLDWGWEAHALRSYATGNRQSYDENRGKKISKIVADFYKTWGKS